MSDAGTPLSPVDCDVIKATTRNIRYRINIARIYAALSNTVRLMKFGCSWSQILKAPEIVRSK
jgi:hypothetical protein